MLEFSFKVHNYFFIYASHWTIWIHVIKPEKNFTVYIKRYITTLGGGE